MLSEHILYSTAIAIIVGMLSFRYFGRDSSRIIILMSWAPDTDYLATILPHFRIHLFFEGHPIVHGTFHNIAFMVIFGVIIAILVRALFHVRFWDALFFATLGFGAHLFEDALVYPADYAYLWPLSHAKLGLGWLATAGSEEMYNADFFHIANTYVLAVGLFLILIAALVRTRIEGPGWIRSYMQEKMYRKYFSKSDP